jgi:prophage regulatory protein
MQRKLIDKRGLKELGIPYCFAHIARLEAKRQFPKRVRLGACRVAWVYEEVVEWIEVRVAKRATTSPF